MGLVTREEGRPGMVGWGLRGGAHPLASGPLLGAEVVLGQPPPPAATPAHRQGLSVPQTP